MKKERIIIIKNPCLRKIRSNLRRVLLQAVSNKVKELRELEDLIMDERGIDDLEGKEVRNKINKLLSLPTGSICRCGNGGSCLSIEKFVKEHPMEELDFTELDMAYIPEQGEWFCLECYKRIKAISEPENI
jgi:hypothetical protein